MKLFSYPSDNLTAINKSKYDIKLLMQGLGMETAMTVIVQKHVSTSNIFHILS